MELELLRKDIKDLSGKIALLSDELTKLKPESKEILTLKELSEFLGKSPSTIYKLTYTGAIPHFKKGKHLYFDRSSILTWIKGLNNKGE